MNGVEKILNYLTSYILEIDDVCKCLKFDTSDCLSKTLTEADRLSLIDNSVENKDNVRIFLQPFINKTVTSARTELRIYPISFNVENRVLAKVYISIDIICHNDIWILDNSRIRPLLILNELTKKLNGANTEGIGLLNLEGEKIPLVVYNDYFSSYRMTFCIRVG